MKYTHGTVMLPSAEQFICQIERLVKIQALAGGDAKQFYFQTADGGIYKGEYDIPRFGYFSVSTSIYNSDYAIMDAAMSDDAPDADGASSPKAKIFTLTRLSKASPWVLIWAGKDISQCDIEQLTSFVYESPQEVFERLFDAWFHDYSGIVPETFALEQIESIYNQISSETIFKNL